MNYSESFINNLSYTDFIALINQTNVPPGSYSTLTRWRINSGLNSESTLFEAACSTGFSILNLIKNSGCKGIGADISQASIQSAHKNAARMGLTHHASFFCEDATTFKSHDRFSHIVVGASFGFFQNPKAMIENLFSMVGESAYLLASPFYAVREVPAETIVRSQRILGITPTIQKYKEIMKLYRGFNVEYEDRLDSIPETQEEIQHYCHSTISRACRELQIKDEMTYEILFKRLQKIKEISNELRQYQEYSVLVLKYDREIYPHRYVELF